MYDLPLIILALALSGIVRHVHLHTTYWDHIERFAKQCNLHAVHLSGGWWGWILEGEAGPLKVQITGSYRNKDSSQVEILIPRHPGFSEVSILPQIKAPWKVPEIEIGSEVFDQAFFIAGPLPLVLARLDAKTRSLLLRVNDAIGRLEIADGKLRGEVAYRQLSHVLPLLLSAGRHFSMSAVDVLRRLAQNATQDPEAGVRLQNLLLLIREHPEDRRTFKVLHAACSDESPEVRLLAGRTLGPEGRGTLLELAEKLENDAVSAEAVSLLGRELLFESTKAILFQALDRHRPRTARACLEALSRIGDPSSIDVLMKVAEGEQGEISAFASRTLGTVENPAAEGSLIQALQSRQKDLRVTAAKALGRIGSTAAVLPLKEAAEHFSDRELHQAARQAIAEIQSRLPGASPGQLSLTGAEAGQLSMAQEAGQLSFSTDSAGQISLSGAEEKAGED